MLQVGNRRDLSPLGAVGNLDLSLVDWKLSDYEPTRLGRSGEVAGNTRMVP